MVFVCVSACMLLDGMFIITEYIMTVQNQKGEKLDLRKVL